MQRGQKLPFSRQMPCVPAWKIQKMEIQVLEVKNQKVINALNSEQQIHIYNFECILKDFVALSQVLCGVRHYPFL